MIDLAGRRVTVLGLGRHGGGLGAARYLARHGARLTISDTATVEALSAPLAALAALNDVPIERLSLGSHDPRDIHDAELIVVNPAIRPDSPLLKLANESDVACTSEIELFLRACPAQMIGVTGTNGKSTTVTLIAEMLRAAGRRCWLGGNLGGSLLDVVEEMSATDWVVIELSSFQLARLPEGCPVPAIVVVTNCTPNHLDWHGDWPSYVVAKQRLLSLQQSDDVAIVGVTPHVVDDWQRSARGAFFVADELPPAPVSLGWPPHLQRNARLAMAAARAAGASDTAIAAGLHSFDPLEHRQQVIDAVAGRTFIDDSKATTPEATIAALAAQAGPVWLLLGGSDKQCDFAPLVEQAIHRARGLACYGAVGARLSEQLMEQLAKQCAAGVPALPIAAYATLDDALAWCWQRSSPGDTILLSPGCASHDQFADYVARAGHFRRLVNDLHAEVSNARQKSLAQKR